MKKLLLSVILLPLIINAAGTTSPAKAVVAPVATKAETLKKVEEKKAELPKVPEKTLYQSYVEPLVTATKKEYQNTKPMRDKVGTFLSSTEFRYLRSAVGLYLLASTGVEYNYFRKTEFANGNHDWIKKRLYNKTIAARTIGGVYLSAPVFAAICDVIRRK